MHRINKGYLWKLLGELLNCERVGIGHNAEHRQHLVQHFAVLRSHADVTFERLVSSQCENNGSELDRFRPVPRMTDTLRFMRIAFEWDGLETAAVAKIG